MLGYILDVAGVLVDLILHVQRFEIGTAQIISQSLLVGSVYRTHMPVKTCRTTCKNCSP